MTNQILSDCSHKSLCHISLSGILLSLSLPQSPMWLRSTSISPVPGKASVVPRRQNRQLTLPTFIHNWARYAQLLNARLNLSTSETTTRPCRYLAHHYSKPIHIKVTKTTPIRSPLSIIKHPRLNISTTRRHKKQASLRIDKKCYLFFSYRAFLSFSPFNRFLATPIFSCRSFGTQFQSNRCRYCLTKNEQKIKMTQKAYFKDV